ncbi:MAG TPA: PAS domain S-box protein [Bacteroidales bacterium]|nr:PAS domain S-box protein [Bacteroidales bacterium]
MEDKIRILYVDDNMHDRKLVRDLLINHHSVFEVKEAESREKFIKYLNEEIFDLVLSDFNIRGFEGLQVIEMVKQTDPNLPVIIITGTGSEEIAIQTMRAGAADYIMKSEKHMKGLAATVKTVVEDRKKKEKEKKAQEALRFAENKYHKLLESMMDGFAFVTMNGIIENCNRAFEQMLAYTLSELQVLKYTDITPQKWHAFEAEIIKEQVLKEGYSDVYEKEYIRKDGTIFPVEIRSFLFKNDKGENDGIWAIVRDISLRKQHEQLLIESEENFRELFEYSPVGKSMTSLDGSLTVNNAFCNMLGYTRDELLTKKWQDITFHEDISKSDEVSKSLLNGDDSVARFEKRFVHKNGQIVWTDISVYLRRDKENNPKFFITTVSDITERKKAEEELALRNVLLTTQQEVSLDGILIVDENDAIISYNNKFVEMMNIHQELLLKKSDEALLQYMVNNIENPEQFLSRVEYLYNHRQETSFDEIHFKDGMILERFSSPMFGKGDHYYGRVWYFRDITNRKNAERKLLESESRFRSYFELSIAGIAITSPTMKWIEVNEYLCYLLGYSREELIALTWSELTYPEDINLDLENFKKVMQGEMDGYSIDKRFVRKDGSIIWTSLSVKCVRQSNGKVDYFMALLFDLTARKQAEESLQKTSSELQLIIKNMLNAFIVWESVFDEKGNYVSFRFGLFNDAYERILRVKQEEVFGKDVFEIWPGTEKSWVEVYGKVATTGIPQIFDMYHEPTKGWYHCHAYRPTDSSRMICVIFEDITARKLMEEKLVWEQYLIHSLLDNIPDYIYFKDLESRFIRINKALARVFGLDDPLKALGKSDFDFFKTEHSQEAYSDEQNIIKSGVPLIGKEEMEVWFDRPSTWVSTTKMPLKNTKGEIIGTFGISRDITEIKKIQDDLLRSKEKAEESDRLKTAFLQNISHEIRTPLNAIVGFSTILGSSELPEEKKKEFANIINVSNDQLLSVISGIIALSTLDAGQEQVTNKETNLDEILKSVYDQFSLNQTNTEVTLSYFTDAFGLSSIVFTDSVKLMQILINLVGNALKFTHKGYVKFGYTIAGNTIQFSVEDSGIGISEDMHDLIFERFRQIDNSSTRKYGGTGLGLALSKGYVDLLGGEIKVSSKPGQGSTFIFTLPYKPVFRSFHSEVMPVFAGMESTASGKKILVAEDDTNNFMLVEEILISKGIKVSRASNGLEALDACSGKYPPDIVLMDIKMPVMDGMEATKKIKAIKPNIIIIALTAYASELDVHHILSSGCDDYIQKPIRVENLFQTLLKYL